MLINVVANLSLADVAAVFSLAAGWAISGWVIERQNASRPSVTVLMARYRRDWMTEMITREPRIFDAAILSSLRQGTTFLASGSMIAVGGVLALAGNAERLDSLVMGVADVSHPTLFWQLKLAVVAVLLTHAVFKFIWTNRLFGYCAVVMAATPNDISDPLARVRSRQAAEINIRAALNFNRGLRSVYFAFAALSWLLGPWALLAATAVTMYGVLSREFASTSRGVLLDDDV